MLVDGIQIMPSNIHDWSAKRLAELRKILSKNVESQLGNEADQKLMIDLIDVEIDRQTRVHNINLCAEKKKQKLIKRSGLTID